MRHADTSKVSSTAIPLAYLRSLSDLPFSKELSEIIGAKEVFMRHFENGGIEIPLRAASLEARSKSIDNIILKEGTKMLLELACGISPRGLSLSSDSALTIVQTDLKPIVNEMERIARKILRDKKMRRENLQFRTANALNYESVGDATRPLEHQRVSVITEGLLNHLTLGEKRTVAQNIHSIMDGYGGIWVCSDIYTKRNMRRMLGTGALTHADMNRMSQMTGRTMYDNAFDSEAHLRKTMEDIGFRVQKVDTIESAGDLSTLGLLKMSRRDAIGLVRDRSSWTTTWVMSKR
ncbi:MAG: hypothetical protein KGH78_04350 [Candidatus Micrarchaeota archaeon]|nr:hypothetical protein [Candidatus Micrarchaeota archaeon]